MKKYISLLLLASLVFGVTIPAQSQIPPESADSQILAQSNEQETIAQDLINLLAAGEFEDAVTKYDFDQNVTAESLEADWTDLTNKNGEFQKPLEIIENRGNIVVIRCEFTEKTIDLIVVLNDSNKVISLNTPED